MGSFLSLPVIQQIIQRYLFSIKLIKIIQIITRNETCYKYLVSGSLLSISSPWNNAWYNWHSINIYEMNEINKKWVLSTFLKFQKQNFIYYALETRSKYFPSSIQQMNKTSQSCHWIRISQASSQRHSVVLNIIRLAEVSFNIDRHTSLNELSLVFLFKVLQSMHLLINHKHTAFH